MMTNCFSAMAGFGPGWATTMTLIAATAALTYLMTKHGDAAVERTGS